MCERENRFEGCSLIDFALYNNGALMELGDLPSDRQSETRSCLRAASGFVDFIESFENIRLILFRDSAAGVFHAKISLAGFRVNRYCYRPFSGVNFIALSIKIIISCLILASSAQIAGIFLGS